MVNVVRTFSGVRRTNSVSTAVITNNVGITLLAAILNLVITVVLRLFLGCVVSHMRTAMGRVRSTSVSLLSVIIGRSGWLVRELRLWAVGGLARGLTGVALLILLTISLIFATVF